MQAVKKFMIPICPVVVLVTLSFLHAYAQTALNDIHVEPRAPSAQPGSVRSLVQNATGLIRKTVDLVLVPVTVMDGANRIVTGLKPENFHLFEDKHPQAIKNFWKEDEPVSVGILLDMSSSMDTKIDRARDAVMALLKASNPEDEFFLITFADQPNLVRDFTQNVDEIESSLVFTNPKGRTSLLDAIVLAVNNMGKAKHRRKALVVISDGGDNRSRYTEKDVKSLVKEADILVYSIGVFDRDFQTMEEMLGPELLTGISNLSGASAYTLDNPSYLPRITQHIAQELRNQYILGYSPESALHDGKWRKIKVKLALPAGIPTLRVQARTGYYAPAE